MNINVDFDKQGTQPGDETDNDSTTKQCINDGTEEILFTDNFGDCLKEGEIIENLYDNYQEYANNIWIKLLVIN
jgi:hypothetical protein